MLRRSDQLMRRIINLTAMEQRRQQGEGEITILAAEGCKVFGTDMTRFNEAINVAKNAKCCYIHWRIKIRRWREKKLSRPDIQLPLIQSKLINKTSSTNLNIVVSSR